ncbi:MAG: hypothetical protein LUE87_03955, partial [Lachnospiraceae bacterium]|nr:hypothetical protein [Lachnospiraceae bacterium]
MKLKTEDNRKQKLKPGGNTGLTGTALAYTALTGFLCPLLWKYPAAAILLPGFLLYEAACLVLYLLVRKKKADMEEYSVRIRCRKYRCMRLMAFTDVFGLAAGEDTYFIFDVLCCVDGIVVCLDLIFRVRIVIVLAREASVRETTLLTESGAWRGLLIFRNPGAVVTLYIV